MSENAIAFPQLPPLDVYPERRLERESFLDRTGSTVASKFVSRGSKRRSRKLARIVDATDRQEDALRSASDAELRATLARLAPQLRSGGFALETVAKAFAVIREASGRVLGKRHYGVQLVGAYAMLNGMIAEMQTGEGKTLTATLAAATACLAGLPTHVVTVNDYLATRDAESLGPLYEFLGFSVGLATADHEHEERQAAYRSDITFCTNKTLAFDYLRDQIVLKNGASPLHLRLAKMVDSKDRIGRLLLRGLSFAIVDEADSVLIDEARTPLLISQQVPISFKEEELAQALQLGRQLAETTDYRTYRDERRIQLTPAGEEHAANASQAWGGNWLVSPWRNDLVEKALSALHLFRYDEQYLLQDGKVVIVDEYTGRVMPDRFWSDGLHQLIELKEGCELSEGRDTIARISYQRFFRRYKLLAGMTGTASDVEQEMWQVYRLPVASIPTNRPPQRKDLGETVVPRAADKWQLIANRIVELNAAGRPVLLGTRTVGASILASEKLDELGLDYQLLNAAQDKDEADLVARAGEAGRITIATNMAGRGTDIVPDEDVLENGGLHVILSERHESRRIDRQLFGRCGRQGAPGSFESILSLEDDLVVSNTAGQVLRWARDCPEALRPGAWRRIVRHAQQQAERLHSKMRHRVLRSDDQRDDMLAFSGKSE